MKICTKKRVFFFKKTSKNTYVEYTLCIAGNVEKVSYFCNLQNLSQKYEIIFPTTLLMFQIAILTLSLEAAFFTISSPWNGMTVRAADSSVSLYNWFLLSALCHIMPSHIKKWKCYYCNITKAICHPARILTPFYLICFPKWSQITNINVV